MKRNGEPSRGREGLERMANREILARRLAPVHRMDLHGGSLLLLALLDLLARRLAPVHRLDLHGGSRCSLRSSTSLRAALPLCTLRDLHGGSLLLLALLDLLARRARTRLRLCTAWIFTAAASCSLRSSTSLRAALPLCDRPGSSRAAASCSLRSVDISLAPPGADAARRLLLRAACAPTIGDRL